MDFLFQTAPQRNSTETQFEMYLAEPQISHSMNSFEWWATREKRYPALAELARKYLCIPATSASSERVFSTAGNVVNSKRNYREREYSGIFIPESSGSAGLKFMISFLNPGGTKLRDTGLH